MDEHISRVDPDEVINEIGSAFVHYTNNNELAVSKVHEDDHFLYVFAFPQLADAEEFAKLIEHEKLTPRCLPMEDIIARVRAIAHHLPVKLIVKRDLV